MHKRSDLRAYQHRVVTYLYEHDAAFAVLKMGAGKTAATLTAIQELIDDGAIRHALVLAPKRVANLVWPDEIEAWEHTKGLRYALLNGGPQKRADSLKNALWRDVTIIGLDNAQWLCDQLAELPDDSPIFDLLVIDETSRLKDPKSKRAKALQRVAHRFKNRWGLTGTPTPNSLLDLFGPAKLITRGRLWGNSFYAWQRANFYPSDYRGYSWLPKPDKQEQLLSDIASISITLNDGDMPELPDLNTLVSWVQLPPDARDAYDTMERKLFADLPEEDVVAMSAAIATGKCGQAAQGYMYGEVGNEVAHDLHHEKEAWIADLVESLDGEPLLIVYEYVEDLRRLQALFPGLPYLGNGVSDAKAKLHVMSWNARQLPLFALHPASGGHGLNLQQGGSRIAFYGLPWSAEFYDQTIARIHRPGQQAKKVTLHVCLAADTVDEMKRTRVLSKLSAQAAFEAYLRRKGLTVKAKGVV